jgi:hypothetical protein
MIVFGIIWNYTRPFGIGAVPGFIALGFYLLALLIACVGILIEYPWHWKHPAPRTEILPASQQLTADPELSKALAQISEGRSLKERIELQDAYLTAVTVADLPEWAREAVRELYWGPERESAPAE